jgi:hypothetical protein
MKKLLLLITAVLIFFSCSAGPDDTTEEQAEETTVVEEPMPSGIIPEEKKDADLEELFLDLTVNPEMVPATAHAEYLAEPMDFFDLPDYSHLGDTAVIGSEVAVFYPETSISTTADLESLPDGIPLPFAEVIPVFGKIENEDREYYGLFLFQEEYNFFYQTKWDGQSGLVFGADLKGLRQSAEHNAITSLLYKEDYIFDQFPPFISYRSLSDDERQRLESFRIALQEVKPSEYNLSMTRPDDMISLYIGDARDKQLPVFITTDLIANGLHLFFNQYLQSIEEKHFIPRLETMVNGYLAVIHDQISTADASGSSVQKGYLAALNRADAYFQIADLLLSLSPEVKVTTERGRDTVEYIAKDQAQVLSRYPENIRGEAALILSASSFMVSPNFGYEEDYSQYKPRGHYTRNGVLEAYFRTMMWFGRLHAYVSAGKELPLPTSPPDTAQDTALDRSVEHLPMAALITEITINNKDLYQQWRVLFDPITELIGMSDDLSFYEMVPFWESLDIQDFPSWADSSTEIIQAVNKANDTLRHPLISGNSVFWAPAADGHKAPMGWRLFGQRFTWDSFIHQRVSPPKFMPRDIVRGLDIMKVFGSYTADQFLAGGDYLEMEGLEDLMDSLETGFDSMSPGIWEETYYNRVLFLIKSQAEFETGMGFYFTETPAWGVKSLLSAHGTWAALRHDTILYVKQVYAERAGDGDYSPTFRTKVLPFPVHYIEPNIPFFQGALASVAGLYNISRDFSLGDDIFNRRIASWLEILERSLAIVELEYRDEEIDYKEVQWIRTIPQQIAPLVVPADTGYASYTEDEDSLKGAIVADVFTNAELGVALEVATGIPYRLYVALNDGQGGKRIAVGYTFSYFEFLVPQNERMTNEEWRAMVYADRPEIGDKLPFWAKGIALPPRK